MIIGVTPVENEELVPYQLKGVIPVQCHQCKKTRVVDGGPFDYEKFKVAFVDRYFLIEIMETKVLEFINLYHET